MVNRREISLGFWKLHFWIRTLQGLKWGVACLRSQKDNLSASIIWGAASLCIYIITVVSNWNMGVKFRHLLLCLNNHWEYVNKQHTIENEIYLTATVEFCNFKINFKSNFKGGQWKGYQIFLCPDFLTLLKRLGKIHSLVTPDYRGR